MGKALFSARAAWNDVARMAAAVNMQVTVTDRILDLDDRNTSHRKTGRDPEFIGRVGSLCGFWDSVDL